MSGGRGSVLLVEPYFGGSHRAWAEGVAAHSGHDVTLLTLPARWWKWRMRGAAVTLAERLTEVEQPPDLILASDMVDLAAFRALTRSRLGDVPTALYFHESQLTYPDSPQMEADKQFAMTNWLSALVADRIFFNSEYHRRVFFAEMPRFLRHFPDYSHDHLVAETEKRSRVLEVGVDLSWIGPAEGERDGLPLRVLWNHRWEHDKNPAAFFAAVDGLSAAGHDFELVVCGENFRRQPEEFLRAKADHASRLVHIGYAPRDEYRRLVRSCDVVVSTARQEFFGVSVVEAIAAGCLPLVPNRLSYPELIEPRFHATCLYQEGALAERLQWAVEHPATVRELAAEAAPTMARYGWGTMGPRYHRALSDTMGLAS